MLRFPRVTAEEALSRMRTLLERAIQATPLDPPDDAGATLQFEEIDEVRPLRPV
jgi:hypothetical protein